VSPNSQALKDSLLSCDCRQSGVTGGLEVGESSGTLAWLEAAEVCKSGK